MALGFAGVISIDFTSLLRAHVFLVLVGYVGITIMGMSMILLPMFWLSHSYSDKNVTYALWFISIGVIVEVISSIIKYIGFMITGHLYKIVPFLVWYERFSPLVGKEKVPMLADMLPKKSANLQFIFSASGVVTGYFGLLLRDNTIFHIGVYALSIGSIFVLKDLLYMIRFK